MANRTKEVVKKNKPKMIGAVPKSPVGKKGRGTSDGYMKGGKNN